MAIKKRNGADTLSKVKSKKHKRSHSSLNVSVNSANRRRSSTNLQDLVPSALSPRQETVKSLSQKRSNKSSSEWRSSSNSVYSVNVKLPVFDNNKHLKSMKRRTSSATKR